MLISMMDRDDLTPFISFELKINNDPGCGLAPPQMYVVLMKQSIISHLLLINYNLNWLKKVTILKLS